MYFYPEDGFLLIRNMLKLKNIVVFIKIVLNLVLLRYFTNSNYIGIDINECTIYIYQKITFIIYTIFAAKQFNEVLSSYWAINDQEKNTPNSVITMQLK